MNHRKKKVKQTLINKRVVFYVKSTKRTNIFQAKLKSKGCFNRQLEPLPTAPAARAAVAAAPVAAGAGLGQPAGGQVKY